MTSRTRTIAGWILTTLGALPLLGAGASKLTGGVPPEDFVQMGYPGWWVYVTGGLELLGVALLLLPRTARWGAALLASVMGAAALTHALHGDFGAAPFPLLFGALVALGAGLRSHGRVAGPTSATRGALQA